MLSAAGAGETAAVAIVSFAAGWPATIALSVGAGAGAIEVLTGSVTADVSALGLEEQAEQKSAIDRRQNAVEMVNRDVSIAEGLELDGSKNFIRLYLVSRKVRQI